MNKQTATNTAPVTQKVKIIVSSIFPQFDATGVHHHGLQKWNIIDPTMINANIIATNTIISPKISKSIFTTFVVLKQLSKINMVFFSTKTTSHIKQLLCQLDAVLIFN